jgi:hypothetical protein
MDKSVSSELFSGENVKVYTPASMEMIASAAATLTITSLESF